MLFYIIAYYFAAGFLVQFISVPVTSGFISAAAVIIASTGMKNVLGIYGSTNDFIKSWRHIYSHIGETQVGDVVLGVSTIIVLIIGKVCNILNCNISLHFSE